MKRANAVGLEADRKARFGKKWVRDDADREAIVAHMRARAVEKGILPEPDAAARAAQK